MCLFMEEVGKEKTVLYKDIYTLMHASKQR